MRLTLLLAAFFLALPTSAHEVDDRAAILAVMDKAFGAVASGKAADWAAIQLDDGVSFSTRLGPDGQQLFRLSANLEDNQTDRDIKDRYLERWTEEPTVRIRKSLATVWGAYDFTINGTFSHCGIDTVQLVKLEGQWKIVNFGWTVERTGCPTDPANK